MPLYEYVCLNEDCKRRQERISRYDDPNPICSVCGHDTEKIVSVPASRNPDYGIQR